MAVCSRDSGVFSVLSQHCLPPGSVIDLWLCNLQFLTELRCLAEPEDVGGGGRPDFRLNRIFRLIVVAALFLLVGLAREQVVARARLPTREVSQSLVNVIRLMLTS